MPPRYRVLVVDPLEETREVLRTALEPQGVHILAAGEPAQGLVLARQYALNLIVLDAEQLDAAPRQVADDLTGGSRAQVTPVLMIGGQNRRDRVPPERFVAKPYHYGPLIRKIEELLARSQRSVSRAA